MGFILAKGTYGAVGAPPHLLQVELLDAVFIWSDSCAFDADTVLDNGIGSIHRHLVICLIRGNDGKVVVSCKKGSNIHT